MQNFLFILVKLKYFSREAVKTFADCSEEKCLMSVDKANFK